MAREVAPPALGEACVVGEGTGTTPRFRSLGGVKAIGTMEGSAHPIGGIPIALPCSCPLLRRTPHPRPQGITSADCPRLLRATRSGGIILVVGASCVGCFGVVTVVYFDDITLVGVTPHLPLLWC